MKLHSLEDLFHEQLRDMFDAEKQLVKALPKLAKASSSDELRSDFEEHLEQTRGHGQPGRSASAAGSVEQKGSLSGGLTPPAQG